MTDNKAVMRQALDALERFVAAYGQTTDDQFGLGEAKKVIVALRAAIAQPEQAPDLQHVIETLIDHGNGKHQGTVSKAQRDKAIAICEAIAQPEQQTEPVAWRVRRLDSPIHWIIFMHYPVDAMNDPEREVQPLYIAQPKDKP